MSTEDRCVGWANHVIWIAPDASLTMLNCTIANNSAQPKGGVITCEEDGTATLENCILWGNAPNTAPGIGAGCLTNRDPLFVKPGVFDLNRFKTVTFACGQRRLPDFIVEEPDYHLQEGSPAIDKGVAAGAPDTDIDGNGRPCGQGVDSGAYEFGECAPPSPKFMRGEVNGDGKVNIADAIFTLGYLFAGGNAPTCLDTADANDDGRLNISDGIMMLRYVFGGQALSPPFGACGPDDTEDSLTCEEFTGCPAKRNP